MKGNYQAQLSVYDTYRNSWFLTCLRYANDRVEAEDMLQEGLIEIFKDLGQYDSSKSKFSTWSSRVLVHALLKYLKKNRWNRSFVSMDTVEREPVEEEFIHAALQTQELICMIQELPVGYRMVFNLYAMEGYSHKEIAEQLGIHEGTSKSQLSKARKELRKKLEKHLAYNAR